MMLKTAQDEVTEKTILNCFQKSEISVEAQTGAMNDHDDPFKQIMDDGKDNSAVEVLEFDLNQLCETRPDLALKNLDRDVAINKQSKNAYHNLLKLLKMSVVTGMRFLMNPFNHHCKMKPPLFILQINAVYNRLKIRSPSSENLQQNQAIFYH